MNALFAAEARWLGSAGARWPLSGIAGMQLLRLALVAALTTMASPIWASYPAKAAKLCKCSLVSSSGCTGWANCADVPDSAPVRPVRTPRDCNRSPLLFCDGSSCKLVCYSGKQ